MLGGPIDRSNVFSFQWAGTRQEGKESFNDSTTNACFDISELLAQVGQASDEFCPQIRTWQKNELPCRSHFDGLDHHHNMVRRLAFIPSSHRCVQVKRSVAFINLQQLINPEGEVSGFTINN